MKHGQATIGVPPQRLSLRVDRRHSRHHRAHAPGQKLQERIDPAAGLAGQRITLLHLLRQRRGVVQRAAGPVDAQFGPVTHRHQQGRLAHGEPVQLLLIQRPQRSIPIEHPQHRVPRCWRWTIRLANPQAVVTQAIGRVQIKLGEVIGQVLAL